MLYEPVKLVHIDVNQELGSEIAEGETYSRITGVKTPDNFAQQPKNILIGDALPQNSQQHFVVNTGEEFLNVAF